MPPAPDFEQACQEFRAFRELIGQARLRTPDLHLQEKLDELTGTMDRAFAELGEAYPKAQAELKDKQAATEKEIAKTRQQLEKLKTKLPAKADNPAPAVPATLAAPLVLVEPNLALRLWQELLAEFGPKQPTTPQAPRTREIWEDWRF